MPPPQDAGQRPHPNARSASLFAGPQARRKRAFTHDSEGESDGAKADHGSHAPKWTRLKRSQANRYAAAAAIASRESSPALLKDGGHAGDNFQSLGQEHPQMPLNRSQRQTHDLSFANGHLPDLFSATTLLKRAVEEAFIRRSEFPYSAVHVLLLCWEEDDLGVRKEVRDLEATFKELYTYDTEIWSIGSEKPDRELKKKVIGFVQQWEGVDRLLIVYYAGHAIPNQNPAASPMWSP